MKNQKRKEALLELSLELDSLNGCRIYELIRKGTLDKVIDKITDEETKAVKSPLCEKGYFNGNEQFLDVLSNFMYYFDMNLAPLTHKDLHLQNILEKQIPEFLLCKNYWGDNQFIPYFTHNMKQTIIKNMYDNIRFIYHRIDKKIWNKLNITDKMDLNDDKDIDILFNLLKMIIWTNINEYALVYLFLNRDVALKQLEPKKRTKDNMVTHFEIVMNHYEIQFERLIESYLEKEEIIKQLI